MLLLFLQKRKPFSLRHLSHPFCPGILSAPSVRGSGCCSHSLRGGNNLSKANQVRLLIKLLSKPHSYEDSAVACMKRLQRNNYEITLSNLK